MKLPLKIIVGCILLLIVSRCGTAPTNQVLNEKPVQDPSTPIAKSPVKEQHTLNISTVHSNWQKFNMEAQSTLNKTSSDLEKLSQELAHSSPEKQLKFTPTLDSLIHTNQHLKERLTRLNEKRKALSERTIENQNALKMALENAFANDLNELINGIRNFWNIK